MSVVTFIKITIMYLQAYVDICGIVGIRICLAGSQGTPTKHVQDYTGINGPPVNSPTCILSCYVATNKNLG
jgi:hypothetical protein